MDKINKIDLIKLKEMNIYDNYQLKKIASKMILHLRYEIMDFCGCGSPEDISFMIKGVLTTIQNKEKNCNLEYTERCYIFEIEFNNVCGIIGSKNNLIQEFILNALNSYGLLEHGSSIWGSWLSDYGKQILCAFEIVGDCILDVSYLD
ncbi:hypothetical protein KLL36_11800 [Clostridioides difficile]|uniref:hypothetical protein n=1 Tax=Clostridioides difficile TaxID=1496 RepID=UPI000D1DBC22|nr:hypothetical protein [Clostridioides difficile]MDL5067716.1 hypothetical protein [Clostridioides difficile]MDN9454121.1 hypothetical protein [Clostridioides difficile]HBF7899059.1 hypothetical protein [Clostridioides difficile]